jgi:hypothetical protein
MIRSRFDFCSLQRRSFRCAQVTVQWTSLIASAVSKPSEILSGADYEAFGSHKLACNKHCLLKNDDARAGSDRGLRSCTTISRKVLRRYDGNATSSFELAKNLKIWREQLLQSKIPLGKPLANTGNETIYTVHSQAPWGG